MQPSIELFQQHLRHTFEDYGDRLISVVSSYQGTATYGCAYIQLTLDCQIRLDQLTANPPTYTLTLAKNDSPIKTQILSIGTTQLENAIAFRKLLGNWVATYEIEISAELREVLELDGDYEIPINIDWLAWEMELILAAVSSGKDAAGAIKVAKSVLAIQQHNPQGRLGLIPNRDTKI